jgi:hypothetical protein
MNRCTHYFRGSTSLIEHLDGMPVPPQSSRGTSSQKAGTPAQKLRSWDTVKHELLRAAPTWSPFSGTAWGCSLIIARFVVNLCVRDLIICPSILVLSKKLYVTALRCDRNYCTCRRKLRLYVCDSQGPTKTFAVAATNFSTSRSIRKSCSPPRGEQG